MTNKLFTHSIVTFMICTSSFILGYFYSYYKYDEFQRRRGYSKSTNGMVLFDKFSDWNEAKYKQWKQFLITFDYSEYLWRTRKQKVS